jgi:hypothetical protein
VTLQIALRCLLVFAALGLATSAPHLLLWEEPVTILAQEPGRAEPGPSPPSTSGGDVLAAETLRELQERVQSLEEGKRQLEAAEIRLIESQKRFDWLTTLLALASLLLVTLSLVVGLAAVFGWSTILKHITTNVDTRSTELQEKLSTWQLEWEKKIDASLKEAEKSSNRTHRELNGRIRNATALIFGRLCRKEDDFLGYERREDLLDKAIQFARDACDELSDVSSEHRWSAINNLAYYLALKGDPTYAQEALEKAEMLRCRSLERQDDFHHLTTFIRVAGQFAPTLADEDLLNKAEDAVETILRHKEVKKQERDEAEQYHTWLRAKRRDLETLKGGSEVS